MRHAQNQYLDCLKIDPSFQGVNRFFVLSFKDNVVRTGQTIFSSRSRNKTLQCYGWWKKLFSSTLNHIEHENIRKTATGQGDDYRTGCLLGYHYMKKNYEVIDLSKQQALDANPKPITTH